MEWKQIKRILGKIWYILWEDESWYSWIISAVVAFVLIKFLVYPGIGLVLGTSHPIVAVISDSMDHRVEFDEWWDSKARCDSGLCTQENFYSSFEISKEEFVDFPYSNGFYKGDIMVVKRKKPEEIDVGSIIIFMSYSGDPIIHRVINKWEQEGAYYFQTKGDGNENSIVRYTTLINDETKVRLLDETNISQDQLIGKAIFRVPYLGYVKILWLDLWKALGVIR